MSFKTGKVVCASASIVIAVVVADTIRPPLLAPARTGSFTSITEPGLTTTPASIEVLKVITSDCSSSANIIALPSLAAWLREVQANAFTFLIWVPNFCLLVTSAVLSLSPTTSKSTSFESILK